MPLPSSKPTRDARSAQRFPTDFPAQIAVQGRTLPVTIIDISRGGALLKTDQLPHPGQVVTLVARSLEVVATVVWSETGHSGLRFHRDVEPLEVVRQNAAGMRHFRTMRTFGAPRPD